ncbi:DoxX-like family protein [Alkalihalobacillus macyae]|uniref:DoxX-like family protein n=1 Tax=Guptibacillus hwajinpoensis TaxID=208199 RepID=UPI00273BAEF7|nr:DoxX-like family protein [Alkalihalobacillus macyae]MDP4550137.1 DoxX-like family protein [Alkalihalobacillus macyae]
MNRKPIYVEIPIEAEMEDLWKASQTPQLHEQWDVRFSSITYLPKRNERDPQDFSYKTKLGFGKSIEGWGRSVGTFNGKDGSRTSSLHFGTDQAISIISEGKGYWKYIKNEDSTLTFLTQYNYKTRFGKLGTLVDTYLFRPLIGWGTALSFDVLKRWLEKGEAPRSQYSRFLSYWMLILLFFFVWVYHGLVPKVVSMHPVEVSMAASLLPPNFEASSVVYAIGMSEILFGCLWLFIRKREWLFRIQILAFPILTISAIIADPSTLTHPFSPLTFNSSLLVLSVIGLMMSRDVPSARSCKRKR